MSHVLCASACGLDVQIADDLADVETRDVETEGLAISSNEKAELHD
jgi:hypothetical protein